ncbi:MAG: hypothetical protein ACRDYA_11865 [Egibacteraceae bacterium]
MGDAVADLLREVVRGARLEIAESAVAAVPRGQRFDVTEVDEALHAEALRIGAAGSDPMRSARIRL